MKTHVIQLDRHDDTTSVIDKINGSKASRILLVWPKRGRVLEKHLELVLIQRAGHHIGAQLACVTDDDDVLDHAKELGIPVFRSSRAAEKIPWRRNRQKKPFEPHAIHAPSYFEELQAGFRPNSLVWWEKRAIRWLAFFLGIGAVVVLLVFLLPGATVKLAFAVDEQTVDLQVWASPDLPAVNLSGGIPAIKVSTIVESKDTLRTTGFMLLPDQSSSGKVLFTNLSDQNAVIPAGSIVQTGREPIIQFRTLQAATLDALPGSQVEVGVRAVQAGSQGNIRSGEIQAVIGPLGTKVSVINNGAIIGGRDVSTPTASKFDLDRLRDQMIQDLRQKALHEFESTQITGNRLLSQTLQQIKIQEEEVEPAFGLPSDQIYMTLRVEFQAWAISDADLDLIARSALDATIQQEKKPLPGSILIEKISALVYDNKQVRWKVRASRRVQAAWDSRKLIKLIAGQTTATAIKNLSDFPGLTSAPQINMSPGWWPLLPLLPARIEVEVR